MGRRGRVPSAFPALYKTSASGGGGSETIRTQTILLRLQFPRIAPAMAALTCEMLLVSFAAFLTFLIVVLFFGKAMPSSAGRRPPNQDDFTLYISKFNQNYMTFSLLAKSTFFVFSKLDLSAYLSYYILSIVFYLKKYCVFYYSLLKSSLKSCNNVCGIT